MSVLTINEYRAGQHFPEFVVAWASETDIGKDIIITENDIKNLIMSKASVHAACVTLMKRGRGHPARYLYYLFCGSIWELPR